MSKTYKATIVPTISGGNIDIRVSANSTAQAIGIIKTLPYVKRIINNPRQINEHEEENHLDDLTDLIKKANAKEQAKLAGI